MAKPAPKTSAPESPAGDMQTYTVRAGAGSIRHNGDAYQAGDNIVLTEKEAAALAGLLDQPEA